MLVETTKLNAVRKLGLPDGLFTDCSEKLLGAWRARAIKMYPSGYRDVTTEVRITLLPCCALPGRRRSPTPWWTC